jgi:hypothetical protein
MRKPIADLGDFMKLVAATLLGVFGTFGLTIVGKCTMMGLIARGAYLPFTEMVLGGQKQNK